MKKFDTLKVARFGLLTALTLILGWIDSMVSGGILLPGIRLGLANTVLLFALYTTTWEDCALLMLVKVALSGFLFGNPSVMLYSLAGSTLSLLVMFAIRKSPQWGAFVSLCAAAAVFAYLAFRDASGVDVWTQVLAGAACVAAAAVFVLIRTGRMSGVSGTSLAGAVAHNVGQIMMYVLVSRTPGLLKSYLPVLVAIGGVVGCLTGVVAERVLKALHYRANIPSKEIPHEDE